MIYYNIQSIGDICMKKVVTSNDHVSLSKIEEALHSKNIFFYSKDEGAEEFLKIYSGMSYLGSDIYVSEADYEEAKRIVDAIQKKEEEEIIEDDSEVKWYQNKRKYFWNAAPLQF